MLDVARIFDGQFALALDLTFERGAGAEANGSVVVDVALHASVDFEYATRVDVALDGAVDAHVFAFDLAFDHATQPDMHKAGVRDDVPVDDAEAAQAVVEDDVAVDRQPCR